MVKPDHLTAYQAPRRKTLVKEARKDYKNTRTKEVQRFVLDKGADKWFPKLYNTFKYM